MQDQAAPRITPVLPPEWDETALDALGAFPTSRDFVLTHWKAQDDFRGLYLLGTLVRHPALAKAFLSFNAHAARAPSIPARVRELLILRMSWLRKSEYEFVQHVILGKRAGITDEEVQRVQRGPDAPGWDAADADIVRAVDELHAHARIGDATWARLSQRYDTQQLMDMIFAVGCYEILAMAINSFATPLDPGVAPLDAETRARMHADNQQHC